MNRRRTSLLDAALTAFVQAIEHYATRLLPTAQTSRPLGGPVVFRHYL